MRFKHTWFPALLLTVVFAIPSFGFQALATEEFGKTSEADRQVSKLVKLLMDRQHLSNRELDDTISRRAFDLFVKSLDPMKVYFDQKDVDELSQYRDVLDDEMKNGRYSVAFKIFGRYLKRVDQRVELVMKLLESDFDFTIDEEMITDRDQVEFAKSEEEIRDRWRKRIKFNLLAFNNDDDDEDEAEAEDEKKAKVDPVEKLKKRYSLFQKRMRQTDNDDVVEMYVSAVTNSYDPHTSYMSTESFKNFKVSLSLQLEGIGATLQASEDDGYTVIKRIVPGGAADKHGEMEVEDKIVAVGQGMEDGETVDVTGMKLDDVVKMIRGKAGTVVRLVILSENATETKVLKITREKIKLEDSAARGIVFEEGKKTDGSPFKVGVIDLPSFYSDFDGASRRTSDYKSTTRDVARILTDFKKKNVDSVVVDLRRNGGGSLREAIDCTGLFIDSGPIVQVKDAFGRIIRHNDENAGMGWKGPLVVLTSKFSASASEILAGAVQDYGRGIVVGDTTTHGKGTVQSLIDLNQVAFSVEDAPTIFGALKITMQQFYRPNGDSTQKRGVLSDIVLPSVTDKMDVGESDLDYPVEFDKIPSAKFRNYDMVKSDLINSIRQNAEKRIGQSEDFQKRLERIEAYVEQKDRKSVTLNKEKYLARREKLSAEKEDEKTLENQVNGSNSEYKRDFFVDEVLRIAVDYTRGLGDKKFAN